MSSEFPVHPRALADPPPIPRWSSHSRSSSMASSIRHKSRFSRLQHRARKLGRWGKRRFNAMTVVQQILFTLFLLISIILGILTLVFHSQILKWLLPISSTLRSWKAGWLLVFLACFCTAFPPVIGYSTTVTAAGFIYGFPKGWYIVSSATVLGATSAFLVCRYFLRNFAKRMVATDKRFAALSLTLKHDGIKLLCMVRLCPLPYSISNGAVSTFPSVSPWAFAFATAVASPKLMLHIWIGARLAMLAEAEQKMDIKTKVLNWCSIVGGLLLGVVTGWVIYQRTIKRAKQLEAEERAKLRPHRQSRNSSFDDEQGYTDDIEDLEAGAAAGLIGGLIEGDELDQTLFMDDEGEISQVDDDAQDLGILMGDESSDDERPAIGLGIVDHEGAPGRLK